MSDIYDIAVLGAGPAGTNAALSAARTGKTVLLIDEQPAAGGQVWRAKSKSIFSAPETPESRAGDTLRTRLVAATTQGTIDHLGDTRLWQVEREGNLWALHLLSDGKVAKRTARALVLASGAREFVQPVPGWTTPGVLGLAGATALLKSEQTPPGMATVVSGTGPLAFYVASEIRRLGGTVVAVVTPNRRRDWLHALPAMLCRPKLLLRGAWWMADLMLGRVPVLWGHTVTSVTGQHAVSAVEVQAVDHVWAPQGAAQYFRADSLCLGHGLIPAIEAAQLAGAKIYHEPALGGWVPVAKTDGSTDVTGLYLCGDGAGIRGADAAEIQGTLAGLKAASDLGVEGLAEEMRALTRAHGALSRFGQAMTALSIPRSGMVQWSTAQTITCRCENLTRATIEAEISAGATSTNALKSGLRAGMGPCGGKFCQTAIAQMIARKTAVALADIPPPTPRPPLRPVPVSAMAEGFDYHDLPIPKPAPL